MYVCMYVRTYVCMYVCMYVRITIENKPINCVSSSSCLGVKLDNKLNWSPHIKMVNWNFHAKISKLKQMKTFNWCTLENIYFKGNLSSVTYCISLWRSFNLPDGFTTSTYVSQSMKFSAWQNGVKEKLRFDVKCSGPCTVRPTLFLNFLFHVEQTERYEIDIFFD